MDEERLPDDLKKAIIDRVEAWDLVDFLGLTVEDVVEAFEERIVENLSAVLDMYNIEGITNGSEED